MNNNSENDITFFAETDFRNQKARFGIKKDDRRRHIYVIGKTGTGKTTLLENMAIQDIQAGRGVAIVDPHGEFAEKMLDFVPVSRINDVIYFNPADLEYPIAFNVMEKVDAEHRHLVASGLVGVFKKIWAETWGPRLEYVLRNAVLALLEYPGSTLLGIMRILVDKDYRQRVIEKVNDPVVKSFWVDEFSKYRGNFEVEAINPIQNKVGQFLTNPLIRNIVGQTKSTINMREMMDEGKILIMNLSKGLVGEDASALLGAMLITKLQLAAMSRVSVPEEERRDFYLYVDEFQNFATESFANILSEARKYRLNLVLAHQYITQMVEEVRDAVFGNVGTMITFRIGAADAEFLENEFSPEFNVNDLVGLGFAQIYLKLMIDGFSSRPFSATTLLPQARPEKSHKEKIIRVSRERYGGLSRQEVEEKIARWSGVIETAAEFKKPERKKEPPAASVPKSLASSVFIDRCWDCGKQVELNFKPDGVRPVYCQECLIKVRSQQPLKVGARKIISEPLIKETGQTISLREAMSEKTAGDFKPVKKPRKEVDLAGLRDVLKEVVGPIPEAKPEKKEETTLTDKTAETTDEGKDIKPGQMIEL
jgi:CxxC-x17-CxxC domain-containing protein